MTKSFAFLGALVCALVLPGCQSAQEHAADVEAANAEASRLTVGTVQREIRVGMSGADVAIVLGSPNIVTTDEQRREVWVYDRISTTRAYSTSSGGVSALILGGALVGDGLVGGSTGGNYSSGAGAQATTQKTLTIVIKYDEQGLVRDFAYHTSTF
jgi:outer membrane protein assembly factor BamE (lipoprotein component of BamABCDE complex)